MIEAAKAAFGFENFTIPSFYYELANSLAEESLNLKFDASGLYNVQSGRFQVTLDFVGYEGENVEKPVVKIKFIGTFKFGDNLPFEEIPDFFYKNSIAILFPYLRSFISTLTLQAHTKLIILDLMNLSALSEPLKKNTVVN